MYAIRSYYADILGVRVRFAPVQLDDYRRKDDKRKQQNEQNKGQTQINDALQESLASGFLETVGKNEPFRLDMVHDKLAGKHFIKCISVQHINAVDPAFEQFLNRKIVVVITSYSIHYTKLYELSGSVRKANAELNGPLTSWSGKS